MSDNKGREIKFVYPISYDAAYCIYDIDDYGEFVYTTYTYGGKFTKKVKNTLYWDSNYEPYFIKYGQRIYANGFVRAN